LLSEKSFFLFNKYQVPTQKVNILNFVGTTNKQIIDIADKKGVSTQVELKRYVKAQYHQVDVSYEDDIVPSGRPGRNATKVESVLCSETIGQFGDEENWPEFFNNLKNLHYNILERFECPVADEFFLKGSKVLSKVENSRSSYFQLDVVTCIEAGGEDCASEQEINDRLEDIFVDILLPYQYFN